MASSVSANLVNYVRNYRASTLPEALNLYEVERYQREMMMSQQEVLAQQERIAANQNTQNRALSLIAGGLTAVALNTSPNFRSANPYAKAAAVGFVSGIARGR